MLKKIRDAVNGKSVIHLFHDGAKIHLNPDVKTMMGKLNIKPVLNVAYRFEYNPCERLWA